MKIDIVTVGGSPRGIIPNTIYERGVGGAELALFSWAEIMSDRGHEIHIYNDPCKDGIQHYTVNDLLSLHPMQSFSPLENRDILITFRGPYDKIKLCKGKKIGWSCDQFTEGDYIQWYKDIDEMILISNFHKNDHLKRYGEIVQKAKVLDLGVRIWEYEYKQYEHIQKVPYQIIFCSIPDRGLNKLAEIWQRIKLNVPEAKLIITSDYTLWGASEPFNQQYREMFRHLPDVTFLGNVNRRDLVRYQLESELHLFTNTYDENFCVANAECQVAGCYSITSNVGALETTNFTGEQYLLNEDWQGNFIRATTDYFNKSIEERKQIQSKVAEKAKERFDWNKICREWENILNG